MPTACTADIQNGISTRKFILQCARAMGACVMQRDEPMDVLPPQSVEPSTYNQKKIDELTTEYVGLRNMTAIDLEEHAREAYEKAVDYEVKNRLKTADIRSKYEAMLVEVKAWNPPSEDHKGLYDFMIKQIEESIEFDCQDYDPEIKELSGQAWYIQERDRICGSIGYHHKENEAEKKRAAERTEWLQQLWNSLPKDDATEAVD